MQSIGNCTAQRASPAREIEFSLVYEGDFRGRVLRKLARECDVLIAFRGCSRRSLKCFKAANSVGVTTVWSSDDDLLELEASNPVGGRYQKSHIRESMEWMIKHANFVWVFSPYMQGKYARERDKESTGRIRLLPLKWTEKSQLQSPHPSDNVVRIGHIGDFTHRQEMLPLIEVVKKLTTANLPMPWNFILQVTHQKNWMAPQRRSFPYIKGVDAFHAWLRDAEWSIGIAPLRDTTFNACKSDNKFRTFGGLGIAGVYADVPPYRDAVSHRIRA